MDMSSTPWWRKRRRGSQCQVVFFQIDLAGHSRWLLESTETIPALADFLRDFAGSVKDKLEAIGFDRLSWGGDGGVFCRELKSDADAGAVFAAADVVFECFSGVRNRNQDLKLRASATCTPYVIINSDPGNFCDNRLNAFIKYERDLALNDAFIITDELRQRMDSRDERVRELQRRAQPIKLPIGDSFVTWVDSKHPYAKESAQRRVTSDDLNFTGCLSSCGVGIRFMSNFMRPTDFVARAAHLIPSLLQVTAGNNFDIYVTVEKWPDELLYEGNRFVVRGNYSEDQLAMDAVIVLSRYLERELNARGEYSVHAAAVTYKGQCILLAGNAGAGKTNLAFFLHLNNHDIAVLSGDRTVVRGSEVIGGSPTLLFR